MKKAYYSIETNFVSGFWFLRMQKRTWPNYVCVCVYSDLLCGSLFCNISANTEPELVNYRQGRHTRWTVTSNRIRYYCYIAFYRTFYNGPDRTDPGFVPDGASCGTGKVAVFDE